MGHGQGLVKVRPRYAKCVGKSEAQYVAKFPKENNVATPVIMLPSAPWNLSQLESLSALIRM